MRIRVVVHLLPFFFSFLIIHRKEPKLLFIIKVVTGNPNINYLINKPNGFLLACLFIIKFKLN